METINILISSAGRRKQFISCFREDAAALGLALKIFAGDMRPEWSPACQQADQSFSVPRCTDPGFIPALLDLCKKNTLGLIVPTIDPELDPFSEHRHAFAAIGTKVVIPSPEVVALARDKWALVKRLEAANIPTPRTVLLNEYRLDPSLIPSPVIAKPRGGSASVGIVRPRSQDELANLPADDYIVQEAWRGSEFTVNMYADCQGKLRCAIPHERLEVRSGEVSKAITRRMPALEDAALSLARLLRPVGSICFQAIVKPSGEFCIFEINARFGGGFPLAHKAGARFTRWILEETLGLPPSSNNDWKDGVVMLRYDSAVFIDG